MSDFLTDLQAKGVFSELDLQFARFMARLSPGSGRELFLASALASRIVSVGGVCLDLAGALEQPPEGLAPGDFPGSVEAWIALLEATPVVGAPGDYTPLVLDDHGRLYLHRYWEYERRLAESLLQRAGAKPAEVPGERLAEAVARIFGPAPRGEVDRQRAAAAVAALRSLCVISGGPGTGKTWTVIRTLALLQELAGGKLRIGLAAPTGKAAARLEEVAHEARETLEVCHEVKDSLPVAASTIHRLLGFGHDATVPRHHRENPLPLDVLVVDEASMVALPLMARLLDALPRDARLILLGDKDQLASVEAGRVLGDICAGEAGYSAGFAARLGKATGMKVPGTGPVADLSDSIVILTRNYRFAGSGIGELARLVNEGKGEEALDLASSEGDGSVAFRELSSGGLRKEEVSLLAHGYRPCMEAMGRGEGAREVLGLFHTSRILPALRGGRRGVREINRLVESALGEEGLLYARDLNYRGRPVMVTVNDYARGLFNGDVGMILPEPGGGGGLRAFFEGAGETMRTVVPARLPEHETVWAMTIHKAQGSEFDRVVLVLPGDDSPVLSRELLYTGITRARRRVEIWGTREVFLEAVARRTERSSGLRDRLWKTGSDTIFRKIGV